MDRKKIILGLVFCAAAPSFAATAVRPQRLTSTVGNDYLPRLTPDGRAVVYVSDRRGNPDIFIRYLPGSGEAGDYPLTFHTARDTSPSVSPTGEQVAFISYRDDGRGDIYIANLRLSEKIPEKIRERLYQRFGTVLSKPGAAEETGLSARVAKFLQDQGSLVRLTDGKMDESEPAWAPSGDKIYFTRSGGGVPDIYAIALPGKNVERITVSGGSMVSPSPDGRFLAYVAPGRSAERGSIRVIDLVTRESFPVTAGPLDASPAWSDNGKQIFFSRYEDDTDGDGAVTLSDHPSLYEVSAYQNMPLRAPHRLTAGDRYDFFPDQRGGKIVFASKDKTSHLYLIDTGGIFSAFRTADELFTAARELSETDPRAAALAYGEIRARWTGDPEEAEAGYRLGLAREKLSDAGAAERAWTETASSGKAPWSALSEIELIRTRFDRTRGDVRPAAAARSISRLLEIEEANRAGKTRVAGARAELELGRIWKKTGDEAKAAAAFDAVTERYATEPDMAAQALLEKAALYKKFGDRRKLTAVYLELLKKYPGALPWSERAAEEAAALQAEGDSKDTKLREIASAYADVPILPALALNLLGDRALERNERDAAEAAYRAVITQFPSERRQIARARLSLARLYTDRGDYKDALAFFRLAEGEVPSSDPWRKNARRRFVGGLLAKGRSELAGKDFRLAARTFRDLISFDDSIPQAHRGLIAAYAALGETGKAAAIYTEERKKHPGEYLPVYGLGLTHTYEEPPARGFARAEPLLLEAAALDGQAVFPHQTLGFVYEKRAELFNEPDNLPRAIDEYLTARELSDPDEDFQNYGDLTLNAGNGYFLLKDYAKAYEYYSLRRSYDLPFEAGNQRLVYLERFARAAFHIEKYGESVALADEALARLAEAEKKKELPPREALSHRAEITDARALSLQAAGRSGEAAEGFTETAALNRKLGSPSNEAKALRNLAINLFETPQQRGTAEEKRLADARDAFDRSYDLLEGHGAVLARGRKIGSLINIDRNVALGGDASEASKGFSDKAERELIDTFIGKIERMRNRDLEALAALNRKQAGSPMKTSILANQRGILLARLGKFSEAAAEFEASFAQARDLPHEMGMALNALSLTRLRRIFPGGEKGVDGAVSRIDLSLSKLAGRKDAESAALAARLVLERLDLLSPRIAEMTEPGTAAQPNFLTDTMKKIREVAAMVERSEPQTDESRGLLLELDIAHARWTGHRTRRGARPFTEIEKAAAALGRDDLVLRARCAEFLTVAQNSAPASALAWLGERPLPRLKPALDAFLPVADAWLARSLRDKNAEEAYNAAEWRARAELAMLQETQPQRAMTAKGAELVGQLNDPRLTTAAFNEKVSALEETERGLASLFKLGIVDAAELMETLGPNRAFLRTVDSRSGAWNLWVRRDGVALLPATQPLPDLPGDLYTVSGTACPAKRRCAEVASAAHLFFALGAQSLFDRRVYRFGKEEALKSRSDFAGHLGTADWFAAPAPLSPQSAGSPLSKRFDLPDGELSRFDADVPAALLLGGGVSVALIPPSQPAAPRRDMALLAEWWARGGVATVIEAPAPAFRSLSSSRPAETALAAGYPVFGAMGFTPEEKETRAEEALAETTARAAELYRAARWEESARYFSQALDVLGARKEAGGISREQLLDAAGTALFRADDIPAATARAGELVELRRQKGKTAALADALQFLGVLYSRQEKFDPAVAALKEAAELHQALGNTEKTAEGYATLGIVNENAGRYREAIALFDRSLEIHGKHPGGQGLGEEWRRIGRIYYLRLNDYGKAETAFKKAVEVFARQKNEEMQNEALLETGLVEERRGSFGRARAVYKGVFDRTPSAKAALYIANTHWFEGSYDEAFRWQRKALSLADAANDDRMRLLCHSTAGLIHWTLNNHAKSIDEQEAALKLSEILVSPIDTAAALNNLGLVYRDRGEPLLSLDFFHRALEIDRNLKTPWGMSYDLRNLGISETRLGRHAEALIHLTEAVRLSASIGAKDNEAKSLQSLADLFLTRGQHDPAYETYKKSLAIARETGQREVEWRALQGLARVTRARNNSEGALVYLKEAIDLVEKMGAAIRIEEFRNSFVTDKLSLYEDIILLLAGEGKTAEAWSYAERSRARSFIDLLGNKNVAPAATADRKLLEKDRESRRALSEAENLLTAAADPSAREKAAARLRDVRKAREDLLIEIRAASPALSAFVSVDVLPLQEFQRLLGPDTAFVEYFLADREILAWVITDTSIRLIRTPVPKKTLEEKIAAYSKLMQERQPLLKESEALHGWLLKPVEPAMRGKRFVGVSPHETLHYLSFASLFDGTRFVADRYPLFYVPSAAVLKFTQGRAPENKGSLRILAVGNPDLGDPAFDLPFAEKEAGAIARSFPNIDVLTRDRATARWVSENIGKYRVIHIAAHGEFDAVNPLFSAIKLAPEKTRPGDLNAEEIFGLRANADLVTLSACQTGLAKIEGGGELIGLNRAFMYAGTRSVLSSLWRVSDVSTAVLIKHFYRNYAAESKAESLRDAQLLVKDYYPHPAYWAAFSLTGDYR